MALPALILATFLINQPSASTFAAVTVFVVNVDRQWPTDDREPAATSEALRLMEAATRALADDAKVNDGKLRDAITAFASAREELFKYPVDDKQRTTAARDALKSGSLMIDRLAAALNCEAITSKERAAVKKAVDQFKTGRPIQEQRTLLEAYFKDAAAAVRSMLDETDRR